MKIIKPSKILVFPSRKGISLIEIIVVIAVLAVLVAFVFPRFLSYRENALMVQCQANLRKYGSAVLVMMADRGGLPYWDGKMSADTESGKPRWDKWMLEGYLSETLRCPLVGEEELESGRGFHYVGNSGMLIYYSANPLVMPVYGSRVVLAAEMAGKEEGFNSPTHFNMTMWGLRDTDSGANLNTAREGSERRAQYHGKPTERGLNLFFMDGSMRLVSPLNLNWWDEANTDRIFFWRDHFRRISLGRIMD